MSFRRLLFLTAASVGACALLAASTAQASTVTVGSPLTASFVGTVSPSTATATFANSALGEAGANVTSPISGTVVRWRMTGAYVGGPFKLRVLRPAGGGEYTGAGTSAGVTPSGTGTQVFTTDLPIQAGDLIGIDVPLGSGIGFVSLAGSTVVLWEPALADGSTMAPGYTSSSEEVGFNADVQPPPGVSSLSRSSGPSMGGTSVTIQGHDFTGASAVSFGPAPAESFAVNSDSQITAVSPPGSAGTVDVRVTTLAGTSPLVSADKFAYTALLTVFKGGSGTGTVTSAPAGIDCGASCTAPFDPGSSVTLTAAPSAGSALTEWIGCDTTNGDQCTVTISADRSVAASFDLLPPGTKIPGPKITKSKINKKHGKAMFTFKAIGNATGFQCALVKTPKKHHKQPKPSFSACSSPKAYKGLKAGKYTFDVRALSAVGPGAPASKSFKIA